MGVRAVRGLGLVVVALVVALAGRAAIYATIPEAEIDPLNSEVARPAEPEDPIRLAAIREGRWRIAPLHPVKTKPAPGEWLARHAETGQTFAAYRGGHPNRPSRRLTTLYIEPWGVFDPPHAGLVARSAELLGRFYGVPVTVLEGKGLESVPEDARRHRADWDAERISTSYILDRLQRERPRDAVALLALTMADLSPGEGGRWVFGQASLLERVGVWSLSRQGDPAADPTTCLRRTLKTALHETGHILGLPHCAAFECGMNGASSRAEADSRPLWFCAECEMKVWWACTLDPPTRYARLAEFADANGLDREARFWRASLAALEGGGRALAPARRPR